MKKPTVSISVKRALLFRLFFLRLWRNALICALILHYLNKLEWHQWFLQPIKDSTTILFVVLCRCQNWLSWNNTERNYYSKSPLFSGNYWPFSPVRLFFCSEYLVRSKEKINKVANGIPTQTVKWYQCTLLEDRWYDTNLLILTT